MDRTNQPESLLAFDELLGRCMGEREFAENILSDFSNAAPSALEEIRLGIEEQQQEEVARSVHRLKGTAATCGAKQLQDSLALLESLLRSDELSWVEILDALEASLQNFASLEDHLATHFPKS